MGSQRLNLVAEQQQSEVVDVEVSLNMIVKWMNFEQEFGEKELKLLLLRTLHLRRIRNLEKFLQRDRGKRKEFVIGFVVKFCNKKTKFLLQNIIVF